MKKRIYGSVTTLAFLAIPAMAITPVNPQIGQSLWEIAGKIGVVYDETELSKPTNISNADASGGIVTISSSGIYRLSEELTNRVVIDTDNVELDLNGYGISLTTNVSGITIQSNRSNIAIYNGYLKNTNTSGPGRGISAIPNSGETISHIYIKHVDVYGFQVGFYIDAIANGGTTKNFFLDSCFSTLAGSISFLLYGATDCVVENCVASNAISASGRGFHSNGGAHNTFSECIANDLNDGYGFYLEGDYDTFYRCVSSKNGVGFYLNTTSDNVLRKCLAEGNNASGYQLVASNYNIFDKCDAVANNTIDSSVAGGFKFSASSNYNLFDTCVSTGNLRYGFYHTTGSGVANFFDECIAKQNTTANYLFGTNYGYSYRCHDVTTTAAGWKDDAPNTGWTARG